MLLKEAFFMTFSVAIVVCSYLLYLHYTDLPAFRPPITFTAKPYYMEHFLLIRDSTTNLIDLPICPPRHPAYKQALRSLFRIRRLELHQARYIRDLIYTFDLALNAYMQACFNEETWRIAAARLEDLHLLGAEMFKTARKLNLFMQVRFPRDCDDPLLSINRFKEKPTKVVSRPLGRNKRVNYESGDGLVEFK